MIPTKEYTGPTLVVVFDRQKSVVIGTVAGKTCYPWSGSPRPQLGERWRCSILSEWTEGSAQGAHWGHGYLVRPMERLS